jgi:ribonuclease-3
VSSELSAWALRSFGHAFADPALCRRALTHRSAGGEHNERLEFLGDSVINCSVARMLYDAHPDADEGALSRLRATLVSGETLGRIAGELGFGEHLRLGPGELKSGGFRRASILADALEAMVGAIFLDSSFDAASASVRRIIGARLEQLPAAESLKDPKTRLQEILQARGLALPIYSLTATTGDPHAQSFAVTCEVPAFGLTASGEGVSRRRAEQMAARKLLELMPGAVGAGAVGAGSVGGSSS